MLEGFHRTFAWFVIVANAAAGAWALAAHWVPAARHRLLWIWTGVAQVSIFVQVAVGVALMSNFDDDLDQWHTFYGFVALITVGLIYSYRAQLVAHRYLLYGLGGLFLMGLGLRSLQFS